MELSYDFYLLMVLVHFLRLIMDPPIIIIFNHLACHLLKNSEHLKV